MKGTSVPLNEEWGSKFCRLFVIIVSIVLSVFVLTFIGMLIKVYAHIDHIWNSLGSLGVVSLVLLELAVLLIVATALIGIQAARTRNSQCMSFYVVFMFLWFMGMLAVGLCTSILTPLYFEPNDPSKCTKLAAFRKLQSYAEDAQHSICYTCNCFFDNSDNFKQYSAEELVRLNTVDAPRLSRTDTSLPVRVQDCLGWNSTNLSNGFEAFEEMEKELECSGWCENTTSLFYRFTNVNRGKPQNVCYKSLSVLIRHYMLIQTVLAFLTSGMCLVAFIAGLAFMCGRRGFRPLGDAGFSTLHQLTNLNGTSLQQPTMPLHAKNLAVSNVMPVAPPPGYVSRVQDPSGNPSNAMNKQSQMRFLPAQTRTNGAGFRHQ